MAMDASLITKSHGSSSEMGGCSGRGAPPSTGLEGVWSFRACRSKPRHSSRPSITSWHNGASAPMSQEDLGWGRGRGGGGTNEETPSTAHMLSMPTQVRSCPLQWDS